MNKMLLIVDPQIDFISGTLPVPQAAPKMDALADYVREKAHEYKLKVLTADWHPYDHCSFKENGGANAVTIVDGKFLNIDDIR